MGSDMLCNSVEMNNMGVRSTFHRTVPPWTQVAAFTIKEFFFCCFFLLNKSHHWSEIKAKITKDCHRLFPLSERT